MENIEKKDEEVLVETPAEEPVQEEPKEQLTPEQEKALRVKASAEIFHQSTRTHFLREGGAVGITRKNKEKSKKQRKTEKNSRRVNRGR